MLWEFVKNSWKQSNTFKYIGIKKVLMCDIASFFFQRQWRGQYKKENLLQCVKNRTIPSICITLPFFLGWSHVDVCWRSLSTWSKCHYIYINSLFISFLVSLLCCPLFLLPLYSLVCLEVWFSFHLIFWGFLLPFFKGIVYL